jgi:hypothetical protein
MPSYTIKVLNDDEGEDLGTYEADYLPRVGDPLVLWHHRVCPDKNHPFCAVVSAVTHEAIGAGHPYAGTANTCVVETVVWLTEEHAPPTLYCDCTEEERASHPVDGDGRCENCGYVRRA